MEWKVLEVQDKKIIDKYTKERFNTCDYNFTNQILWSIGEKTRYKIEEDILYLKGIYEEEEYYYMPIPKNEEIETISRWKEGIKNILPVVSLFFLALYRMLPSIIRIVGVFQGFAFYAPVPGRIEEELSYSLENLKNEKVDFSKKIEVKDLEFEYEKNTPILDKVSLSIEKGDRIAFIGESGSGKTTLVDILMGLYRAKSGKIYVDGVEINNRNLKDWRKKIGYIPQEIYLFDGTVGENVSIGHDYDEARVIEVLKQAKIWEFFKNKEGVHTKVGDAGIMLSGGQKQRVGIARALYKEQEILVLDEATSALDDNTEEQIIDELYNLAEDKTLIMIAHRLTTLKKCNKIFQLEKGKIKKEYSNISEVIKAKAKIDKE